MQRSTSLLCAVFGALVLLCSPLAGRADGGDFDESDVTVLGADNFDSFLREELALVEFYAPWCGHCKHLAPEFAKAATALKAEGIKLGKVDATVHGGLASKYKVTGYPKLVVLRNGRESDYNGPREHKGIVSYMQKQSGPAAKPLTTADDFKKFTTLTNDRDIVIVGFFAGNAASSQLKSSFMMSATKLRDDFHFGIVTDNAAAAAAGVELTTEGTVIAYKQYDDKKTVYSGSTKTTALQDWMATQNLPVVGEYTKERAPRYHKRGLPIAKYFMKIDYSAANAKQHAYILNRLTPLAKEYDGKLIVTIVQASEYAQQKEEMGWKNVPSGFLIEDTEGKRYRFEGKFSADGLRKFTADYFSGRVPSWVKSEEPPINNDGPVKVLTGKTFNEIVTPDKDVLIEFYAPWCGHCKALTPKYEKLGKKFKSVDSVVIAKIDATNNDYDRSVYAVSGYPTVYLKPAGKGSKPVLHEGQREVADFVSFIKKNSKTKWSFRK